MVLITWITVDDLNYASNNLNRLLKNVRVTYGVDGRGYVDLELRDRDGRLIRILARGLKRREAYRIMSMLSMILAIDLNK